MMAAIQEDREKPSCRTPEAWAHWKSRIGEFDRLECNPGVRDGKPVVKGTDIYAGAVLEALVALGIRAAKKEFPSLDHKTIEQIREFALTMLTD